MCGLNRLAVAVAESLVHEVAGADVVVVTPEPDTLYGPMVQQWARVVHAGDGLEVALREHALVTEATCMLALADQDLENMRAAALCHAIAPHVPMVVRVFDQLMAQHLEALRVAPAGQGLNIRRAYSLSALAAPAFVAAALGEEHLLTMRMADAQVPFFRLDVHAGSPMRDRTLAATAAEHRCTVVAYRPHGAAAWLEDFDDAVVLHDGDAVVVGGPDAGALRLAAQNSELFRERGARREMRGLNAVTWLPSAAETGRGVRATQAKKRRAGAPTLLPKVALFLSLVMLASMVVIGLAWRKNPIDAFYWTLSTAASGAPTDDPPYPTWLKLFAFIPIMAGGALLGVIFSYFASVATAQRLDQRMDRRAARMRNHVVVGGLGTVGFRIERLLGELGIPTVVIELSPEDKFAGAAYGPVLHGDLRVPQNLERAAVRDAACLIAVTDDDLANIEACLNAKKLNPGIHTVARIFDDTLADQSERAFGIAHCSSASRIAARAFVDAASDDCALRHFRIGDRPYLGFRLAVGEALERERLGAWRSRGVHVVAVRRADDPDTVEGAPSAPDQLARGDEALVVGPAHLVRRLSEGGVIEA